MHASRSTVRPAPGARHAPGPEPAAQSVFSAAAREAWVECRRMVLEGEMRRRVGEVCAAEGLTPGLVKTLAHLAGAQPVPMRDLADAFGCDSSYITGLVDGLEEENLAERRPHATDRRVKTVALTPRGRRVWERVSERLDVPPASFAVLSPAEARTLQQLLHKLVEADSSFAGR